MQANQQGTVYKSLAIERNGENYSNTMLKNEFLKKTENYFHFLLKKYSKFDSALRRSAKHEIPAPF